MDPSTTLVTFFLQTDPSVKSVKLIGSWDTFTVRYTMDRDPRRGRGHWKGCHAFQNISCESAAGVMSLTSQSAPRSGGLKMGHDYYYYYEVNGSTEIYDPAQPTTTACPYLPGQTVNSLYIPEERTLHSRSASTTNLGPELFRTMNPKDKYAPTRTAAQLEADAITNRMHTATSVLSRSSPDRSPSPPSWRRFFSRREESRGRSSSKPASIHNSLYTLEEDERSVIRSEGTRTRDISPESLRRFLCDDSIPSRPSSRFEVRFSTIHFDDDADDAAEDDEDDDNFASMASPTAPAFTFATRLSPPPTQRSNNSFTTVIAKTPRVTTSLPKLDTAMVEQETPFSSPEIPSFDDSGDDSHDEDSSAVKENMSFAYKLPVTFGKLGSTTSPKLVGKSVDEVDDDLSELGWMVGAISIGN